MAFDTEIEVLKSVVNKLDSSLEKISEVSNSIGKLLAVHDERLNSLEKVSDKKDREIDELHSRITTQTREIMDKLETMGAKIDDRMKSAAEQSTAQHNDIKKEIQNDIKQIENRLTSLEQWKWYVLGGAAVIGYILHTVIPKIF
jgi:chromosome segregation ATPase